MIVERERVLLSLGHLALLETSGNSSLRSRGLFFRGNFFFWEWSLKLFLRLVYSTARLDVPPSTRRSMAGLALPLGGGGRGVICRLLCETEIVRLFHRYLPDTPLQVSRVLVCNEWHRVFVPCFA